VGESVASGASIASPGDCSRESLTKTLPPYGVTIPAEVTGG
jgi:hypothetical protein